MSSNMARGILLPTGSLIDTYRLRLLCIALGHKANLLLVSLVICGAVLETIPL